MFDILKFRGGEAEILRRALLEPAFGLIHVSGPQGMGKSDLVRAVLSGHEASILNIPELPDMAQSKYWQVYFPELDERDWPEFFRQLAETYRERKGIIVLLNFQRLLRSAPRVEQSLRRAIREDFPETELKLIIVETYLSEEERDKSLARGFYQQAVTTRLELEPLDYRASSAVLAHWPAEEQLYGHSISGGRLPYLKRLASFSNLKEAIQAELLATDGMLQQNVQAFLRAHLREPALYELELMAMAGGASRQKEISEAAGLIPSSAANYLRVLLKLGLITKRQPYRNVNPRLTRYEISEPIFRFAYHFLYRLDPLRQRGLLDEAFAIVEEKFYAYFARDFQEIARVYLLELCAAGELPQDIDDFQPWWNDEGIEIDLIGSNAETAVLAACLWAEEKMDIEALESLKRKSRYTQRRKNKIYFLFSRSGFSPELIAAAESDAEVYLISLFGEA